MAFTLTDDIKNFTGLSSDTKPTADIPAGSTFIETDTGSQFVYDGAVWKPTSYGAFGSDFLIEVQKGNVEGHSVIHKFGRNDLVGTSFVPVSVGGVWPTLQPAAATTLRVKAGGNANDIAGGSGARKIMVQVIDETGALIEEEIELAGASASSATTVTAVRLLRAWISECGVYATVGQSSHNAAIVVEDSSGTQDWATLDFTDSLGRGQSEIGCYTVPTGFNAYILSSVAAIETNKIVDLLFLQRELILKASAPFPALRIILESGGASGIEIIKPRSPLPMFEQNTDFIWLAKVSTSTAKVDIDFEIMLVDNTL